MQYGWRVWWGVERNVERNVERVTVPDAVHFRNHNPKPPFCPVSCHLRV